MILARYLAAPLLLAMPGAALAQADGPQQPTRAVTRANANVAADVDAREIGVAAVNLDARAQYAADIAAYDRALGRNDRRQRRYARRERAYADAMAAWRVQVRDCHHGVSAACRAPTPNPGDYR